MIITKKYKDKNHINEAKSSRRRKEKQIPEAPNCSVGNIKMLLAVRAQSIEEEFATHTPGPERSNSHSDL